MTSNTIASSSLGVLSLLLASLTMGSSSTPEYMLPQSTQNSGTIIRQGDSLENGCALSYIDNERGRAYTAAHCMEAMGKKIGDTIRVRGIVVGTYSRGEQVNDLSRGFDGVVDTAEIKLRDGMHGENIFSGDVVVSARDAEIGDPVCIVGNAHPARTPKCGVVESLYGSRLVMRSDPGNGAVPGDSGGAAYIPGKGYVGVVTSGGRMGSSHITSVNVVDSPANVFTWD